jgi:hypothetical protein
MLSMILSMMYFPTYGMFDVSYVFPMIERQAEMSQRVCIVEW